MDAAAPPAYDHRVAQGDEDARLLEPAQRGDPGALEALIAAHEPLLRSAVKSALARAGAGPDEDLADEALVRVHAALHEGEGRVLRSFRGRSRLGTFLAVVARRVAIRLLEQRRPPAERARREPVERAEAAAAPDPSPLERASDQERAAIVRRALAALPPRDALALRLFYQGGMAHKEIGAILKVPVTSVGQILARAREKLRIPLQEAGLADSSEDPGISSGPGRHESSEERR
jgi:RNA polymerase sigma-70 factor (ECF subfamily)